MVNYNNTHYNDQKSTVENYDLCRHVPPKILSKFAEYVIGFAEKSGGKKAKILEEGVGNGRFFIPLLKETQKQNREDKHYAIDDSRLMLDDLKRKTSKIKIPFWYESCEGDIQNRLSYEDNFFDAIYTFAVYHILQRPKDALDEVVRVLKPGGSFVFGKEFNQVFHGTEAKMEPQDSPDFKDVKLNPKVKDFFHKYHELRIDCGVPFVASGVLYSDPSLVINHLKGKGLEYNLIKDPELEWEKPHTFRQMLDAFRLRNITTFGSDISDNVRLEMYSKLMNWCEKNSIKLDNVFTVPANISLHIFSKN